MNAQPSRLSAATGPSFWRHLCLLGVLPKQREGLHAHPLAVRRALPAAQGWGWQRGSTLVAGVAPPGAMAPFDGQTKLPRLTHPPTR
jgi:hypothetical protein